MELPEIKKPKFLENLDMSDVVKICAAAIGGAGVVILTKLGEEYIPTKQIEPVEVNDILPDNDGDNIPVPESKEE